MGLCELSSRLNTEEKGGDMRGKMRTRTMVISAVLVITGMAGSAPATLDLGPEQIVQAAGSDIFVNSYSVPSFADWNNDGRCDLIVGDGGGIQPMGRVRIYLNSGTASEPAFTTHFYVMAGDMQLSWPASGCMGIFPRVIEWDGDDRKDLLIGTSDGKVRIYLNTGTDTEPVFDGGAFVQVGYPTLEKVDIHVMARATPVAVDWNTDGRKDLVVGSYDGKFHIFINEGTDSTPDFWAETFAQEDGADLLVPGGRSSPTICDVDLDGNKDLITGNTQGQLLYYRNVGTDISPSFSGYESVLSEGVPIQLPANPRSRPFACDWSSDGYLDLLVGSADGLIHLFEGPASGTAVQDEPELALANLNAYPNPFNPRVNLAFNLPSPQNVRIKIFDLRGNLVAVAANRAFSSGSHTITWDGRDRTGHDVPAGTYLVNFSSSQTRHFKKIMLVK